VNEMRITPIKDNDGTDAIVLDFSRQKPCKLNNMQLDHLKEWLNENWCDSGIVKKRGAPRSSRGATTWQDRVARKARARGVTTAQ
jgi:hypothetical protein